MLLPTWTSSWPQKPRSCWDERSRSGGGSVILSASLHFLSMDKYSRVSWTQIKRKKKNKSVQVNDCVSPETCCLSKGHEVIMVYLCNSLMHKQSLAFNCRACWLIPLHVFYQTSLKKFFFNEVVPHFNQNQCHTFCLHVPHHMWTAIAGKGAHGLLVLVMWLNVFPILIQSIQYAVTLSP